ncbi:MAG TPA: sigma-70 family RNA polymerase sigma factor [Capillimicrobium sp.]|nr:sigma-70 family RNA polymerase sigma factor [Capillimicrobium sp.]
MRLRSDEQLVALFRAGNEESFQVIFDRYRQRLFAYTRQMLSGSRQDAEDALQDVFLRAYAALRANDRPVSLRAWLYRVAHNRCIDQLRRPTPAQADVFDMSRSPLRDPLQETERREDLRRLVEDVQRLPEAQRSALLMREIDGLSYQELADALDVTVPAIKSLLVRARIGLVEAIEARDADCAEIRSDLLSSFDRGVRASGRARRHLRDCSGCRDYKAQLRTVREGLGALSPSPGPLAALAKLFGVGGAGGSAVAGGGAVLSGGGGAAVVGSGAAAATACKVAAIVCSAAIVGSAAGAGERALHRDGAPDPAASAATAAEPAASAAVPMPPLAGFHALTTAEPDREPRAVAAAQAALPFEVGQPSAAVASDRSVVVPDRAFHEAPSAAVAAERPRTASGATLEPTDDPLIAGEATDVLVEKDGTATTSSPDTATTTTTSGTTTTTSTPSGSGTTTPSGTATGTTTGTTTTSSSMSAQSPAPTGASPSASGTSGTSTTAASTTQP